MPHKSLFSFNKKLLLLLFLSIFSFEVLAQISISFPTNRIVFQRNNDNIGFVNIIGNYSENVDKVEAKLTPIVAGQGVETGWTLVQDKPKAGYFAGKIQGQGGWYRLDIRAIRNNSTIQTVNIEKVGIGEVFIALGQSNAQGIPNYGAIGATDDRVNAINFQNSNVLDPLPENLNFVQLSNNVNVAPQGDGPWCYGELGDRLVRRLNVPVAFFNEGLLLVSVINWRESAEGKPTFNFVLDVGGRFQLPNGLPYINLKNTLQYYGALMGVRSLLWIQGETDNSPNRLSADAYSTNLQRVIDISRKDFDENLSWMVARTSVTYLAPSNAEIIGGQNRVINTAGNNVFAGPFTDNLQIPRPDNVHFQNVPGNMGISLLAENWDKSLDDNFFRNSRPILAKPIIEPEIICNADNRVIIKLPEGLKSYEWSNNAKTNQITVDKGIFSVAVKDTKGNKLLVPSVNTNLLFPSQKPFITSEKGLEFCADDSAKVELIANLTGATSFIWNSGATTNKLSVRNSGEFSVKGINSFGCVSESSENVFVKANPTPAKPKIKFSPANSVCVGETITLETDATQNIFWSNNSTTQNLKLSKIGVYELSVRTRNDAGCSSPTSDKVLVEIKPVPNAPRVIISPANDICEGTTMQLLVDGEKIKWSNNDTTKTLKLTQVGNYQLTVKIDGAFGCVSESTILPTLSINSSPKQPTLSQIGLFTLNVSSPDFSINDQFEWKRDNVFFSKTTTQSLKVSQDGNYQVSTIRTYQKSNNRSITCSSSESNILTFNSANSPISIYPNPTSGVIYIETKENIKNLEVLIYNLIGQQVLKFRAEDTTERKEVDLKNLEKGSYIIKIKGEGYEDSSRLIIQK